MKMLGVAADIYAGLWDGSKYVAEALTVGSLIETPARIVIPYGAVQIMAVDVTQWGGSVTVIDAEGVETIHRTTDRRCAEVAEQIAQDCVPVVLELQEITRGKNAGKQKLVRLAPWSDGVEPPAAPDQMPITADDIPFVWLLPFITGALSMGSL
jgi:hypothetical protein